MPSPAGTGARTYSVPYSRENCRHGAGTERIGQLRRLSCRGHLEHGGRIWFCQALDGECGCQIQPVFVPGRIRGGAAAAAKRLCRAAVVAVAYLFRLVDGKQTAIPGVRPGRPLRAADDRRGPVRSRAFGRLFGHAREALQSGHRPWSMGRIQHLFRLCMPEVWPPHRFGQQFFRAPK